MRLRNVLKRFPLTDGADGAVVDAEHATDRGVRHGSNKGADLSHFLYRQFLRACAAKVVLPDMDTLRLQHFKILWAIVVALMVLMVDDFLGEQWSSDHLFGDKPTAIDVPITVAPRMARLVDPDVSPVLSNPASPCVTVRTSRHRCILQEHHG